MTKPTPKTGYIGITTAVPPSPPAQTFVMVPIPPSQPTPSTGPAKGPASLSRAPRKKADPSPGSEQG